METPKKLSERICEAKHPLAILVVIGLVIRFILAPTLTFNIDVGYWTEVIDVFQNGFGLYGTAGYYYTPVWGYCLGTIAGLMQMFGICDYGSFVPQLAHLVNEEFKINAFVSSVPFNTMVKIPLILVDTAVGVLLYDFVMRFTDDKRKALLAAMLWIVSPLIITQSSVHGMFDNMSAMMILITVMLMVDRKYFLAGAAFSTAVLTKFFPIFFIFFLVAYILKKEGVDSVGVKNVLIAIAGFFAAFALIYLPNIIKGDFWQSLYFLAYRIGITRETLASIGPAATAAVILAIVAVVGIVAFVVSKYGPAFMTKMRSVDEKRRNKKAAKYLAIAAAVFMVAYGAVFLIKLLSNSSVTDALGSVGLKMVVFVCIFSVFLELYLSFRLLMLDSLDDERFVTLLFLSSLAVILWPCAPSYILVSIPFMIVYIAVMEKRYLKAYVIFSVLVTFQEITAYMTSPTSLMLMINGDIVPMMPVYEFLANPWILGMTGTAVLTTIIGIAAYLSLLYFSYKWYKRRYKEGRLWQS